LTTRNKAGLKRLRERFAGGLVTQPGGTWTNSGYGSWFPASKANRTAPNEFDCPRRRHAFDKLREIDLPLAESRTCSMGLR
jgi:hypothetical protein